MSSAGTKKRMQRSAAEQKAYKARQMAAMRDLASLRRDPVALSQVIGTNIVKPFRMQSFRGSGEIKSLDIASVQYPLNTTGSITCLNLIRAGSSFFNRIGRKISLKSIHIKGNIGQLNVTRSQIYDYCRVMLVYDMQTNGSNPSIADIIQDTDQAGTSTTTSFSSANLNNRDRFRILADWRLPLPSATLTAGVITNVGLVDPTEHMFDIDRFIPLKGLTTQFRADSSPAVVGDVATGGLFLLTFGQNTAGAELYAAQVGFRLRYTDN
ncbi:Cap2 [Chicken proventriculitis-associated circular virus 30]|nr:Cap2 [Chicken proventriculitis-associated circular virus 30]